jgi:hypothetical protein
MVSERNRTKSTLNARYIRLKEDWPTGEKYLNWRIGKNKIIYVGSVFTGLESQEEKSKQ